MHRENHLEGYLFDQHGQFWYRENQPGLNYSDGTEVEQRLYANVQKAKDRRSVSPELAAAIGDWPSEYHLSAQRHCLLRPLGIQPGERVLELGCGCGAITRYLGELGARTVAVEGSPQRARIAAQRCRGLETVQVVVDDLTRFDTQERFDWVLLIGVLEYAPVFAPGPSPVETYLDSAKRFLTPSGRLVIAIENKLGLKYFNGCSEDHLGKPNVGIQGLYGPESPITFGRQELQRTVRKAGLNHLRFYYPFPDYKLPSVILWESAFHDPGFDPVDMLANCHSRDYSGWPLRHFDDALVFAELGKNGLIEEFSNSFLLVATEQPLEPRFPATLALAFSPRRLPEFAVQTRIERHGGVIVARKEPLEAVSSRQRQAPGYTIVNRLPSEPYYRGRQILWRLLRARCGAGGPDSVRAALRPWFRFLLQHAIGAASGNGVGDRSLANLHIPGSFVDCTPFNLIEDGETLHWIDREWDLSSDIPLGWVVTRGVLLSAGIGIAAGNPAISVFQTVAGLCAEAALSVTIADVQRWLSQESAFQTQVTGRGFGTYPEQLFSQANSAYHLACLQARVGQAETRIRQLLQEKQAAPAESGGGEQAANPDPAASTDTSESGIARQVTEHMQAGRPAQALQLLSVALRQQPSSELWNDWASAAFACGDPELAESGFRQALQLDPSHRQAAINLAALLLRQGHREAAIPVLQSLAGRLTAEEAGGLQQIADTGESFATGGPSLSLPQVSAPVPLLDASPNGTPPALVS